MESRRVSDIYPRPFLAHRLIISQFLTDTARGFRNGEGAPLAYGTFLQMTRSGAWRSFRGWTEGQGKRRTYFALSALIRRRACCAHWVWLNRSTTCP